MKKKIVGLMLAALMAMTVFAGCGSTDDGAANAGTEAETDTEVSDDTEEGDDVINIGVIQQMKHGSLDAAYEGFVDGLEEAGYVDGENVKVNYQNASGDLNTCQQICDVFKNDGTDMVLAIATNAAQSAVNVFQETEVPVLFTAVTDPVDAGLVDSNEAPGKNVTGTSDMPVIADQIAVIKEVLPEAKTLGILYTSSESNSELQANEAKAAAEALGFEVIIQTASTTNDIAQVVQSVVGSVDAVYIPSDNAFASSMATVNQKAVEGQLPVFCAVEDMIKEGGIATTAVDYYELGKQTAAQAVRILEGEAASEIPVETQKEFAMVVNKTFAESVGVEVPASVLDKAATVY